MKKLFFLLPAAAIVSMGCEPTYCTLSFDTVWFIWTDSVHTPHHVVSVVRESQDTLATQFENTPPTSSSQRMNTKVFFYITPISSTYIYSTTKTAYSLNPNILFPRMNVIFSK